MDGSISYDPKARLEPVFSGATVMQGDKFERLEGVRIFDACSQRQLRSIARVARIFDAAAGTILPVLASLATNSSSSSTEPRAWTWPQSSEGLCGPERSVFLNDVPGLAESLLMTLSRRVRLAEESTDSKRNL